MENRKSIAERISANPFLLSKVNALPMPEIEGCLRAIYPTRVDVHFETKKEITVQNTMTAALVATYGGLGLRFQGEIRESEVLKAALRGGSKTVKKKGDGTPEAVIFLDNTLAKPLAVVECKAEGGIAKARGEAQEYVRHCAKSKVYVPLAIGFDGVSLTVDYFTDEMDGEGCFSPCLHANGQSFMDRWTQNRAWPTQDELLAASKSSDGQIRQHVSVLEEAFTRDFIRQINDTMQVSSVPILDRVVIFTAFLVACRSDHFRNLLTSDKLTVAQAGRQTLEGFGTLIEQVVEEDVREGLKGFVSFIKPKLVSQTKGEDANGAVAIHRMIQQDIPAVCAKHKFTPEQLVDALNASMFNLVDVYEAFKAYAPDNDLGQYFTPRHIVRAMIRLVEQFRGSKLNENDIVYDPACGVGGFLVGALERVVESKHGAARDAVKRAFGARLMGCEPAAEIIQVARINLWMHGDCSSGIFKDSSLERDHLPNKGKGSKVGDNGFGSETPAGHPVHKAVINLAARNVADARPTVVLMNPPFPPKSKPYHAFEFVEHALKQLREGGILCAVVPATTVVVEDKAHKAFRSRVLMHAQLLAVIGMPPELFAPGASVNTYIIVLRRQSGGHQANQSILFARCPDDGYVMSKATKRRVGPSTVAEKKARRWTNDGDFGGHLADLLAYNKPDQTEGDWWVKLHREGGVDVPRHAVSANLSSSDIVNGAEWSPERFINDHVDPKELLRLANRIYAEMQAFELVRTVGGVW